MDGHISPAKLLSNPQPFPLPSEPLMLGWLAVSEFGKRKMLPDLAICSVAQGKSWHGKLAGAGLSLGQFDMAVFGF